MANVDGVAQIEMRDDRGGVRGVVVHVVTIADLARPAMAAPVVSNDAIPLLDEVHHLCVPVVGAQWPAMMEDDGLRVLGTPGLVVDLRAIFGCDRRHVRLLVFENHSHPSQSTFQGAKSCNPARTLAIHSRQLAEVHRNPCCTPRSRCATTDAEY